MPRSARRLGISLVLVASAVASDVAKRQLAPQLLGLRSRSHPAGELNAAVAKPDLSAAVTSPSPATGQLSPDGMIMSIFKSIIGIGIFALSVHVVRGPGLVLACALAFAIGALSAWTFFLVGRAAADVGAADNKSLWAATVGPGTTWVLDVACAIHAFGGMVQYYATMAILVQWLSSALAESVPSLRGALGGMPFSTALNLVSAGMVPLCLARNLSALASMSAFGVIAVLYSVALVLLRAVDGSYRSPTGAFAATATGPVTNIFGIRSIAGVAVFLGAVRASTPIPARHPLVLGPCTSLREKCHPTRARCSPPPRAR